MNTLEELGYVYLVILTRFFLSMATCSLQYLRLHSISAFLRLSNSFRFRSGVSIHPSLPLFFRAGNIRKRAVAPSCGMKDLTTIPNCSSQSESMLQGEKLYLVQLWRHKSAMAPQTTDKFTVCSTEYSFCNTTKNNTKFPVTDLLRRGASRGFPSQRDNNVESISHSWLITHFTNCCRNYCAINNTLLYWAVW